MNYRKKWNYLQEKEKEKEKQNQEHTPKCSTNPFNNIPVFVLNLDRSSHRYQYMKKQYDAHAIPFTRVSAVDGKQLTIHKQTPVMKILCNYTYHDPILNHYYIRDKIQLVTIPQTGQQYPIVASTYELGCTLSHYRAHSTIKQQELPIALIMEDDMSLQYMKQWPCSIETILSLAPKDWTIIQLYTNNRNLAHSLYEGEELFHKISSEAINDYWGTGCYLINQQGISKIQSQFNELQDPFDPHYTIRIREEILTDRLVYKQPGAYLFTFPLFNETQFTRNDILRPVSHAPVHEQMTKYIQMIYSFLPSPNKN